MGTRLSKEGLCAIDSFEEEPEPKKLKHYTSQDAEDLLEGFEHKAYIIETLKSSHAWREAIQDDNYFIGGALDDLYTATEETNLNTGCDNLPTKQREVVAFLVGCGLSETQSKKLLSNVIMKKIYENIKEANRPKDGNGWFGGSDRAFPTGEFDASNEAFPTREDDYSDKAFPIEKIRKKEKPRVEFAKKKIKKIYQDMAEKARCAHGIEKENIRKTSASETNDAYEDFDQSLVLQRDYHRRLGSIHFVGDIDIDSQNSVCKDRFLYNVFYRILSSQKSISKRDGEPRMRVTLLISTLGNEKNIRQAVTQLASRIIGYDYGTCHTGLLIGEWKFDWYENSLVRVRSASAQQKNPYQSKNAIAVITLAELTTTDDIKKMFNTVAKIACKYNGKYEYSEITCNCQTFVSEILDTMNIRIKNPSVAEFVERLKKGDDDRVFRLNETLKKNAFYLSQSRNGLIVFEDRNALNNFCWELCHDNYFKTEEGKNDEELLKAFDRSFFIRDYGPVSKKSGTVRMPMGDAPPDLTNELRKPPPTYEDIATVDYSFGNRISQYGNHPSTNSLPEPEHIPNWEHSGLPNLEKRVTSDTRHFANQKHDQECLHHNGWYFDTKKGNTPNTILAPVYNISDISMRASIIKPIR